MAYGGFDKLISHSVNELKVVAAPWNIAKVIVYDSWHNIHAFLEHGRRIDCERCTASKPGSVSTELKLMGGSQSITC